MSGENTPGSVPVKAKRPPAIGRRMCMAVLAAVMMTVSAFATDGGSGTSDAGMTAVIGALDTVVTLFGKVWTLMTGNPYLAVLLAVSLLSVGFRVFRRAKRVATH